MSGSLFLKPLSPESVTSLSIVPLGQSKKNKPAKNAALAGPELFSKEIWWHILEASSLEDIYHMSLTNRGMSQIAFDCLKSIVNKVKTQCPRLWADWNGFKELDEVLKGSCDVNFLAKKLEIFFSKEFMDFSQMSSPWKEESHPSVTRLIVRVLDINNIVADKFAHWKRSKEETQRLYNSAIREGRTAIALGMLQFFPLLQDTDPLTKLVPLIKGVNNPPAFGSFLQRVRWEQQHAPDLELQEQLPDILLDILKHYPLTKRDMVGILALIPPHSFRINELVKACSDHPLFNEFKEEDVAEILVNAARYGRNIAVINTITKHVRYCTISQVSLGQAIVYMGDVDSLAVSTTYIHPAYPYISYQHLAAAIATSSNIESARFLTNHPNYKDIFFCYIIEAILNASNTQNARILKEHPGYKKISPEELAKIIATSFNIKTGRILVEHPSYEAISLQDLAYWISKSMTLENAEILAQHSRYKDISPKDLAETIAVSLSLRTARFLTTHPNYKKISSKELSDAIAIATNIENTKVLTEHPRYDQTSHECIINRIQNLNME